MSYDYDSTPPAAFTVIDEVASTPTAAPVNTDPAVNSAIDAMVAAQKAQAQQPTQSVLGVGGRIVQHTSPDIRVNTGTGEVTILAEAASPSDRIPDDPNFHPMDEVASIESNMAWTKGELDRVVYDRNTGKPSPAITGEQRSKLELQLASLTRARDWATQRAAALFSQREADEAARQQKLSEDHARFNFTKGNATREKALNEALLRAEADEQARAIVTARTKR